jgi:hypothetical protein
VRAGPQVDKADNVAGEQHVNEEQLAAATASPDGNPRQPEMGGVHSGQVRQRQPDVAAEEGSR